MDRFKVVGVDGSFLSDIYTIVEELRNNKVRVQGSDGTFLQVHKRRLMAADTGDKLVAFSLRETITAACPTCRKLCDIADGKAVRADCEEANCPLPKELVLCGGGELVNTQSTPKKGPKVMSQIITQTIDLDVVKTYGELWMKTTEFDHATIQTKAFVLLSDDPPRKLSFNTYNGTLGKNRDITSLGLESFKNNDTTGCRFFAVRMSLADMRSKLQKGGYIQV